MTKVIIVSGVNDLALEQNLQKVLSEQDGYLHSITPMSEYKVLLVFATDETKTLNLKRV